MNHDDLCNQEQQLLASLDRQLRRARRQSAVLGGGYAFLAASLIYTAIANFGVTEPMAAICYGGVVVLTVDAVRRLS